MKSTEKLDSTIISTQITLKENRITRKVQHIFELSLDNPIMYLMGGLLIILLCIICLALCCLIQGRKSKTIYTIKRSKPDNNVTCKQKSDPYNTAPSRSNSIVSRSQDFVPPNIDINIMKYGNHLRTSNAKSHKSNKSLINNNSPSSVQLSPSTQNKPSPTHSLSDFNYIDDNEDQKKSEIQHYLQSHNLQIPNQRPLSAKRNVSTSMKGEQENKESKSYDDDDDDCVIPSDSNTNVGDAANPNLGDDEFIIYNEEDHVDNNENNQENQKMDTINIIGERYDDDVNDEYEYYYQEEEHYNDDGDYQYEYNEDNRKLDGNYNNDTQM